MRILVTWGTELGGTEGIAGVIGEVLERAGFDVDTRRASDVRDPSVYDAAIIGGALYANRWHYEARRFVSRNVAALRRIPVWLFSSGPLDASADQKDIPPTAQVAVLMERIGARGHATFGGRLRADAEGFPASAMAKTHSGDWRNPDRIRAWTMDVARGLPTARPGVASELPARAVGRMLAHGIVGWALCAVTMGGLLHIARTEVAVAVHAVVAPLIFTAVAVHYFRKRGSREPLPTALAWTATVAVLDTILAGAVLGSFAMFRSVAGTWLPFGLIFLAAWTTGALMSTMPWPKPSHTSEGAR